jgi:hypothetical protein
MSKANLAACTSCARHVRVDEAACPFCGAPLDDAFRALPAPRAFAARLGRAALYALGAAGTVSVTMACGGGSPQPPYGAPPPICDGGDAADCLTVAHYGGAPVLDSGAADE